MVSRRGPLLPRVGNGDATGARASRATRSTRKETMQDARRGRGGDPRRTRVCVASPDVSRRRLSAVSRRGEENQPRFVSRRAHSARRAVWPRASGDLVKLESVFESSRDSGFWDETTTVRGHESHDVREDEKNDFA